MNYKDKEKSIPKNRMRNSFLARLIAIMMAVSMVVPYQAMPVFAAQPGAEETVEETAGENGDVSQDSEEQQDQEEAGDETDDQSGDTGQAGGSDDQGASSVDQKQDAADNTDSSDTVTDNDVSASDDDESANTRDSKNADRSSLAKNKAADDTSADNGSKARSTNPIEDRADALYGDGGTARTFSVDLRDDKHSASQGPVYAGQLITYSVNVSMQAAATHSYDEAGQELMFKEWDNITILMKLPENVSITDIKQDDVASGFEPIQEDIEIDGHTYTADDNIWRINLVNNTRGAARAQNIDFDIDTTIDGNGRLPDGTELEKAQVWVSATFDVRIKEDTTAEGAYKTYSKTFTDETDTIKLSTPDNWVVSKAFKNFTLSPVDDPKTVTVRYEVKYGLEVGGSPEDDINVYIRPGRVPFDGDIQLKEIPTLTLHNGNTLDPIDNKITVTPAESGYKYKDGSSADDTSGPKPIEITPGSYNDKLPYAVVGTDYKNDVDPDAPAYSRYYVDIEYDYDEFKVWYHENVSENDAKAKSENTAYIKYKLLGQDNTNEPHGTADGKIEGYIHPGHLTINKYIVNYNNNNRQGLYSAEKGFPKKITDVEAIKGPATYKVFEKDGTTPAVLYYKCEKVNGEYKPGDYMPIGNTLTINPSESDSETNGNQGTIGVYLDPGEYVVKETGRPDHTEIDKNNNPNQVDNKKITVLAKQDTTADFDNKEKLGGIVIHKTDESGNKDLKDVVFGLYYDENHTRPVKGPDNAPITATTNTNGIARFTRIPPGTYYLWENEPPENYIRSSENAIEVEVNAYADVEKDVTNKSNKTTITLHKEYKTVVDSESDPWKPVTADHDLFSGAFQLQRKIGSGEWENVRRDNADVKTGIDNEGNAYLDVDKYDENGNPISYRFVETIPNGYYDVNGNTGQATSDFITPANGKTEITMRNRKSGVIKLTKKKVRLSESGSYYDTERANGKVFYLYRTTKEDGIATNCGIATTAGENNECTFSGLMSSDGQGGTYIYYVVEYDPDQGYTWVTDSEIKVDNDGDGTADGDPVPALKIGSFTTTTGGTIEATTYNIENKVPIGIIKRNRFKETQQLAGATFEIKETGSTVTSISNGAAKTNIELGKVYTIKETSVPAGYYLDADDQTVDTTNWMVKPEGGGYKVVNKTTGAEVPLTYEFLDTPYKKVKVTKSIEGSSTVPSGVEFSVYVKDNNGKFVQFKLNNTPVKITANSNPVLLPDGEYYLHEDKGPANSVNPDLNPTVYEGKGEYDQTNKKFYFGSFTVSKPETAAEADQTVDVPIINIPNKGNLKATKVLYNGKGEQVTQPAGFTLQVFTADDDGNPVKHVDGKDKTTDGSHNGEVIFEDLPVYDNNGEKIKYVVKELEADNDAYYTYDPITSNRPVQLTLGTTADAGEVVNYQYVSAEAVKKYYDARENVLTGLTYELEGAVIALYKKEGNNYTFVRTAETDSDGIATFNKLEYTSGGYLAVEVSIPEKDEYKYMVPADGKEYLKLIDGKCPETLSETEISKLNTATLSIKEEDSQYIYKGDDLFNVIPWTQIHIIKYDNEHKSIKLDGADFTLYKQVLPEGTPTNEVLTFNQDECDVVGHYTSGTWIKEDEPQEGEFRTDVLDNADNIVYWLVEDRAPSGYSIIPTEKIVLFTRKGTNYSCDDPNVHVYTRDSGLVDNKIMQHKVYNDPGEGEGGTINRAFIEFTKWRQQEKTDGTNRTDFVMMPNATFDLYAVDTSTGRPVLLLDTITTGDENTVDGDQVVGNKTGYGVSRALDAWEIFDEIENKFPDQRKHIITYKSNDGNYDYPYQLDSSGNPVEDGNGNKKKIPGTFYLNATLVEKSSSSKYALDLDEHNLLITFEPGSRLSVGNRKYAVTDITDENVELCQDETASTNRLDFGFNDPGSIAIVDYLSTKNAVVLRHFGYDPEQMERYEMFHEDLEAAYRDNRALFDPDPVVTFKLQKSNPNATGGWEDWNPSVNKPGGSNTFNANGAGYQFAKGLDPGEYRVIMTSPADGYENFYPDEETAFHFTVTTSDRTQTFRTYSPSMAKVTIRKTDLEGNSLDANFKLADKTGNTLGGKYTETRSTVDGTATFDKLPANTNFILEETQAPKNFTSEYFAKLFAKEYPEYKALVNKSGSGYALSYKAEPKVNDATGLKEMVIKNPTDGRTRYNEAFDLQVRNAKKVNLKITKTDKNDNEPVDGATFAVYYHAFEFDGEKFTAPSFPKDDPQHPGWSTLTPGKTGTDGSFLKKELNPGVYYVVETQAPAGYELNTEGKTIVMTGGLSPIEGLGEQSDDYIVNTNVGGTGELGFKDIPKVNLTVNKIVDFGSVPARNYSFKFTLKDENGNELSTSTASKTGENVKPAEFENLSQGNTYYLFENPDAKYHIKQVKIGDRTISPVTEEGKLKDCYKIEIPDNDTNKGQDITVEVENILLEARVTIFKYNGNYEAQEGVDPLEVAGLTGAEFEVLKADKKTEVEDAIVRPVDPENKPGQYEAIIPLENTDGGKYYIHEIKAPEGYSIDEPNAFIEVEELKPGQNRTFTFDPGTKLEYTLANYKGVTVRIRKYGNMPGVEEQNPVEGAKFQMYYRKSGETWNTWHKPETTEVSDGDKYGTAEFQVLVGNKYNYEYAIAEVNQVTGYEGLEGIYEEGKITDKLRTDSFDGKTLYILNIASDASESEELVYDAYNIPFLPLVVEKQDYYTHVAKDDDHPDAVKKPETVFNLYEFKDEKDADIKDYSQIPGIISSDKVTLRIDADETKYDAESGQSKSRTYTNIIRPGKTYLAVETLARDSGAQSNDYSIIQDDANVISYKVLSVPEKGYDKEGYTITFVNKKAHANVGLTKTVDGYEDGETAKVDSLVTGDVAIKYWLEPSVDSTYALKDYTDENNVEHKAFRLTDTGLTAQPTGDKPATLAEEWYTINSVSVGQGNMVPNLRGASGSYPIKATVTFVGFDDKPCGSPVTVDVTNGPAEAKPSGADGKNIKSFYIDYSSPKLKEDTGYDLGQNFTAEKTGVNVTVFQQTAAVEGEEIVPVTEIINNSDVELSYIKWSPEGVPTPDRKTAADDAVVEVDIPKAPVVKFEKDGPDTDKALELGSTIVYKLTATNVSDEDIDFVDPIITDLLPQGIVIDRNSDFVEVDSKPDTISDNYDVTAGYAGDSEYVNIKFNGTLGKDESLTVLLTAKMTDSVTNYGYSMINYAFLSSSQIGIRTTENEQGATVMEIDPKTGQKIWASELVDKAKALECSEGRAQDLKDALGKPQAGYGYLGASHTNTWLTDSEIACIKAEYGPTDGGIYRTDKLAVLNNVDGDDPASMAQRTMHYQLTINNLSSTKRTNLAVMDILPAVGDYRINNTDRGSHWQLFFDKMGTVTVNGAECTNYKVYYYHGDSSTLKEGEIRTAIDTAKDNGSLGADWNETPKEATAFIVVFGYDKESEASSTDDKTVILNGMDKLQIEYTAVTPYREAEELNKIVFTNAGNDFNFGFSNLPPGSTAKDAIPRESLGSNVVEVTIAPPSVKVGGDVWIDSDENGKQDDGDQSWYWGYDIVKQLTKELSVQLNVFNERNFGTPEQKPGEILDRDEGQSSDSPSDPKYGIAHFEFDKLTAAKLRAASAGNYVGWNDGTAGNLIGKNPFTYHMVMNYAGSTFTKTQNIITPMENRGSYPPDSIPDKDQKDDNFEATRGNYRTEQFFLHQTEDVFDMTKDVGFNLHRTLKLTKNSYDDHGKPVEGAEFTIYGPFEHGKGADAELTKDNEVATLTTDSDGVAKTEDGKDTIDLFFFKEYVIVEKAPGDGFSIEGAIAESSNSKLEKLDEEGKWLLNVPRTNCKDLEENISVYDPESIEVSVEKVWDDDDDAYASRPDSIKVALYTDKACTTKAKYTGGKEVESRILEESNGWKTKWNNLPKYKETGQNEKKITYYVKETENSETEAELHGYNAVIEPEEGTGDTKFVIINTPITTGLDVTKRWEDSEDYAAPVTAVTFRIENSTDGETWTPAQKDGKDITLTIERKPGEKMGTATVDKLPAYDSDNTALMYRATEISITVNGKTIEVKEGKVGGYEVNEKHKPASAEAPEAKDLSEIKNTMILTEFSVEKSFVEDEFNLNKEIKAVTVQLQRKTDGGKWTDVDGGSYDLTRIRGWKHTWKKLPKFDWEGNAFEYRAIEVSYTTKSGETVNVNYDSSDKTSGTVGAYKYTSSTEGTDEDGFTTYIENTPPTGGLEVTKNWKNSKNKKLPESLKVTLKVYVHGKEVSLSGVKKSVTLSKENNWADSTTWAELPVYYTDGSKISYRLTESGKGRYDAEYSVYYDGELISEGDGESLDVTIYANDTVKAKFTNTLEGHTRTGDEAPLTLYLTLLIVSAGVLLALFIRKRRSM